MKHHAPVQNSPAAPLAPSAGARHGAITAVVCLALAAVVAAMSSLNVALPDIARSTHATQTQLSWIIDAYSLVFAAFLLPAGALGDRYGRRRALLVGLTVFGAASVVAMTATGAEELIALRAALGLGAALVMPATLSTITGTFPPAQRLKAVSIWAGVAGGAAIIGVVCSGVLLEFFSWRSVFGLNVALAAVAFLGTIRIVPESADKDAPALDVIGALLAVVGLVAVVYAVIEAPTAGWLSAQTLAIAGLGLLVLIGFVAFELKHPHPMLDPRIFSHRGLSAGSLSIFVQFFAFFGFIFLVLQYLQIVRGESALTAAVSMLPLAVTMMPVSRLAPKLSARFGSRQVCTAGLLLITAALVVLAQLGSSTPYWLLASGLLVLGAGMGAAMTPATSAITYALPTSQQGVASAMNDLSREVGGALGIAVIGSIMTAVYRGHLSLTGVPAPIAEKARDSLALAAHAGGPVAQQANSAFIDGIHVALLASAAITAIAALAVTLLLPRRDDTAEQTAHHSDSQTHQTHQAHLGHHLV
jgi:EmrB/QacA subfamily drug resistance transporter